MQPTSPNSSFKTYTDCLEAVYGQLRGFAPYLRFISRCKKNFFTHVSTRSMEALHGFHIDAAILYTQYSIGTLGLLFFCYTLLRRADDLRWECWQIRRGEAELYMYDKERILNAYSLF